MGSGINLDINGEIGVGNSSDLEIDFINAPECLSELEIIENGGQIKENSDGSVSVFIPNLVGDKTNGYYELAPYILNEYCCTRLKNGYVFDKETQKCLWADKPPCSIENTFKIVLNPIGNDGSIFELGETDNCFVKVDFDYLFKIKCETLASFLNKNNTQNSVSTQTQIKINQKNTEIENQKVLCESLQNEIDIITTQITNTPYSIFCNLKQSLNTKLFCLTDPDGLTAWENILGTVRFQAFLNGDQNSFDCNDVTNLLSQNNSTNANLVYECEVPFNTKYYLIKQKELLEINKKICDETLTTLESELIELENELAENTEISCTNPIDMFEGLNVSMTLEYVDSNNVLQTAYEDTNLFPEIGSGLLYSYLLNNPNSGFYVCGGQSCKPFNLKLIPDPSGLNYANDTSCNLVINNIIQTLYAQSGLSGTTNGFNTFKNILSNSAFTSNWLSFSTIINDPNVISLIANKKIKVGLKINHTCGDVCILIDNIKLDKVCQIIEKTEIFVTKCPGFELEKVIDNKKSWLNNTTRVNRNFKISDIDDTNSIRQTNYDVNDERLVINTKEIDLNIDIASAIETDVWCYTLDNPCILTGVTNCNSCYTSCPPIDVDGITTSSCAPFDASMDPIPFSQTDDGLFPPLCCGDNKIDFNSLLSTPLSSTTSVEEFVNVLATELIDAKNRQTISAYPTIKALYDRYLNSLNYCSTKSSAFNYVSIDKFTELINGYWFDIVEQVVPSTTIWGSVKVYKNSIFDQQKFKYRSYSSLLCENPFTNILPNVLSPINKPNGQCETNVEVIITNINLSGETVDNGLKTICGGNDNTNKICLAQMNHGSEFIGTVSIIGNENTDNGETFNDFAECSKNQQVITNCDLNATVILNGFNASLNLINATAPVTYQWSNGSTDSTTTFNIGGIHSVTITDSACCKITKDFEII